MAIPFFEPKPTTFSNNNNNNNINQNNVYNNNNNQNNDVASTILQYDQVDGHAAFTQPVMSTTLTISTPTAVASTAPVAVTPSGTTISQNPITSSNTTSTTASASTSTSTSSTSTSASTSTSTIEQQALAWKILALAMCKALREYYLQTASSKDAFTNQTVQVLPNGEVQPLWK